MGKRVKIDENYLFRNFHEVQKIIKRLNKKYHRFPDIQYLRNYEIIETEDKKPYIIQPVYTYKIHGVI